MIRFVDIRNQGTAHRFAFFSTVTDCFLEIDGQEAFDSYEEVSSWRPSTRSQENVKVRMLRLMPEWTKDGQEDDVEKWYGES